MKQYPLLQYIIVIAWVLISIIVILNTIYLKTGIIILVFSMLLTIIFFMPPKISSIVKKTSHNREYGCTFNKYSQLVQLDKGNFTAHFKSGTKYGF